MTHDDHAAILADLPLLEANELDDARAAAVRTHLDSCTSCRQEWERVVESVSQLRAAAATPPTSPADLDDFFERRIASELSTRRPPTALLPWLARAAVLLAAFTAGMLVERWADNEMAPTGSKRESAAPEVTAVDPALNRAYEEGARGRSGLARGLLALRTLRDQ